MIAPTTEELRGYLATLEETVGTLQTLSLFADAEEKTRLEHTCTLLMAHVRVLRDSL